jgi:formate--tetrahydrofolate ligase
MKTDIEIARETKLNKIEDVAEKLGVPRDEVQNYGRYIAKVPIHLIDKKEMEKHNLILVSAITPNKAGVGKTTVSIGLSLGLNKIGKKKTSSCSHITPSVIPPALADEAACFF